MILFCPSRGWILAPISEITDYEQLRVQPDFKGVRRCKIRCGLSAEGRHLTCRSRHALR